MRHEDVIGYIRTADSTQTDDILEAAIRRKRELYPGWEIFYYATEKGNMEGSEEWIRGMWELGRRNRGSDDENAREGTGSVHHANT